MPDDTQPPIEPENDLSEAARQLSDRFLAADETPEVTYDAGVDLDAGYIVPSPEDAISWRDAVESNDLSAGVRPYTSMVVDVFADWAGQERRRRVALLLARVRIPGDDQPPSLDWERIGWQAVAQSRAGADSSSIWSELAHETNIDLRMVVQDTPSLPAPPSLGTDFSWDAMAESVDIDFRLLVPENPTEGTSQWTDQYRLELAEAGSDDGWRTLGTMDYVRPLEGTPVGGAIGWNLSPEGDEAPKATEQSIPVPDVSFAPDNFLQTPTRRLRPSFGPIAGFKFDIGRAASTISFHTDRPGTQLVPEVPFSIDESEAQPAPSEARSETEASDPGWDALVEQAEARIEDSNLDHETGSDEESGTGLDDQFGRDGAKTPLTAGGRSLDDAAPPPAAPTPPDDSVLDFIEAEPPAPVSPAQSVLDYVDQRPPSDQLEAVDRALANAAPGESSARRVPVWTWPAAAAAIVAIIAFVALSGGDDDPSDTVPGGAAVPTAGATLSPTVGATTAPTAQPTVRAPAPVAEIPTLRICPDGTTFSGYEQSDGSFLDAETGEPRVCPPPPN